MISLKTKNWRLDGIETILFDKDGTFIDVHIYWGRIITKRIAAVIKFYNLPQDSFAGLCLSLGLDVKTNKLIAQGPIALLPRDEVLDSLTAKLKEYGIQASKHQLGALFTEVNAAFQKEIYSYIKLLPGAQDLFKKLKAAGVKTAVITSDAKANAKAILKHLNIEEYFDLVMGREDCPEHKRTGLPAIHALQKLGMDKSTAITVGDAPMDSQMAFNGGLKASVLTATGQLPLSELRQNSVYTVSDLSEIEVL